MGFMFSLIKVNRLVKRLVDDQIPTRLRQRIRGGIQAFSLQEFTSINANGRSLALNRNTGESRTYRVVHDKRTTPLLYQLSLSLLPNDKLLYCSLDHSQFGPFCIAVLSVSFRKGRSLPLWCQVNKSPSALMKPLLKSLEKLKWYPLSTQSFNNDFGENLSHSNC